MMRKKENILTRRDSKRKRIFVLIHRVFLYPSHEAEAIRGFFVFLLIGYFIIYEVN